MTKSWSDDGAFSFSYASLFDRAGFSAAALASSGSREGRLSYPFYYQIIFIINPYHHRHSISSLHIHVFFLPFHGMNGILVIVLILQLALLPHFFQSLSLFLHPFLLFCFSPLSHLLTNLVANALENPSKARSALDILRSLDLIYLGFNLALPAPVLKIVTPVYMEQ